MFRFELISIFLIVLISVLNAAEFPKELKRCKIDDSECQKNVLQDVIEKFHSKGHRGINLIPFDPFTVKSLTLPKVAGSPVNIELKFNNITMTGISNVKLQKTSGLKEDGPNKFLYEIEGNFPQIILTGPYSVDGKVISLAINGEGDSKIIFDNIDAKVRGKCSIVEKKGKKYLNVDQVQVDLRPKKTTFSFKNLFNGDETLGKNMNDFLNENWEQIYNELKPVIMEAIGKILIHIVNGVFTTFEYSDIFLPA